MSLFKYSLTIISHMDFKDFKIITGLVRNPMASMQEIGDSLSISESAVRKRLLSLKAEPVNFRMNLIPTAVYLKRRSFSVVFENTELSERIKKDILKIEDVAFLWSDHNRNIIVTAFTKEKPDRVFNELTELIGHDFTTMETGLLANSSTSKNLSRIEWKIVYHVIENPRISDTLVSKKTGLSRKTVMRYRHKMIEQNVLLPVYSGNFSNSGSFMFGLIVRFRSPYAKNEIINIKLAEAVSFLDSLGGYFLGYSENIAEFESLLNSLRGIEDIAYFDVSVPTGGAVAVDRLMSWVKEAIDSMSF